MTIIQSHKQFLPAFKARLSSDKETKNIIELVSSYGNKQDRLRAYALEKLLNKLDTDDEYALVRDEYEAILLKNTKNNETVQLTDRPISFIDMFDEPRAVEKFFNKICILFKKQMDGSQFNKLMLLIKSDFDKIDK